MTHPPNIQKTKVHLKIYLSLVNLTHISQNRKKKKKVNILANMKNIIHIPYTSITFSHRKERKETDSDHLNQQKKGEIALGKVPNL